MDSLETAFNELKAAVSTGLARELGYLVLDQPESGLALDRQVTLEILDQRKKFVETSEVIIGYLIQKGLLNPETIKSHIEGR